MEVQADELGVAAALHGQRGAVHLGLTAPLCHLLVDPKHLDQLAQHGEVLHGGGEGGGEAHPAHKESKGQSHRAQGAGGGPSGTLTPGQDLTALGHPLVDDLM